MVWCTFLCLSAQSLDLMSHYDWGYGASNLWGYTAPDGKEYALVGLNLGLGIVDISDPTNPVEVFHWQGQVTIWREIKEYNGFLYMVMETFGNGGIGDGLVIVDMNGAPDNFSLYQYYGDTQAGVTFDTGHTIFIDENGIAYIFGANYGEGGAIMLDLNTDPINPQLLGVYDENYIHDGFVRGDTLWAGEIYNGWFSVINVADKSNPIVMATQQTPDTVTHNTWLSDDSKYIFTTDEVAYAKVACYDVSDINDIKLISQVADDPSSGSIPHNTYYKDGFIITSWYEDGLRIHDATHPQSLVQMTQYDTYPQSGGADFVGCWGVYPYFPSGIIIASDMSTGLFVLQPHYLHASLFYGTISDISNGNPIAGAQITLSNGVSTITDMTGNFQLGFYSDSEIDITIQSLGYQDLTITNLSFKPESETNYDFSLFPLQSFAFNGQVIDESGNAIPDAIIEMTTTNGLFNSMSNDEGEFGYDTFFEADYQIVVGKWGYITTQYHIHIDGSNPTIILTLAKGYYDDFYFDYAWQVSGDASKGIWVRDAPLGNALNGIPSNPASDNDSDLGLNAFVTGNSGASASEEDVDEGSTILTSPLFDLTSYNHPIMSYDRWFSNMGGDNSPNDSLIISLSNGDTTVVVDQVLGNAGTDLSQWIEKEIFLDDFITSTSAMQLTVYTADQQQQSLGHLVDAGIDVFYVRDSIYDDPIDTISALHTLNNHVLKLSPNPVKNLLRWDLEDMAHQQSFRMQLTDMNGCLRKEIKLLAPQGYLDFSKLSNGIYLISILDDNNKMVQSKKIIKQE